MKRLRWFGYGLIALFSMLFGLVFSPGTWLNRTISLVVCSVLASEPAMCSAAAARWSSGVAVATGVSPFERVGEFLAQRPDFVNPSDTGGQGQGSPPPFPQTPDPDYIRDEFQGDDETDATDIVNMSGVWSYKLYRPGDFGQAIQESFIKIDQSRETSSVQECDQSCDTFESQEYASLNHLSSLFSGGNQYGDLLISWEALEDSKSIRGQFKHVASGEELVFLMQAETALLASLVDQKISLNKTILNDHLNMKGTEPVQPVSPVTRPQRDPPPNRDPNQNPPPSKPDDDDDGGGGGGGGDRFVPSTEPPNPFAPQFPGNNNGTNFGGDFGFLDNQDLINKVLLAGAAIVVGAVACAGGGCEALALGLLARLALPRLAQAIVSAIAIAGIGMSEPAMANNTPATTEQSAATQGDGICRVPLGFWQFHRRKIAGVTLEESTCIVPGRVAIGQTYVEGAGSDGFADGTEFCGICSRTGNNTFGQLPNLVRCSQPEDPARTNPVPFCPSNWSTGGEYEPSAEDIIDNIVEEEVLPRLPLPNIF